LYIMPLEGRCWGVGAPTKVLSGNRDLSAVTSAAASRERCLSVHVFYAAGSGV